MFLTAAGTPEHAAIKWLEQNAQPLATDDPAEQTPDLAAFDAVVGKAQITGFGEATHGSREFFQIKDRAFRHLVAAKGFTGFAIEANFAACEAINAWVKGGAGDPEKLITGMGFWTWNTEEVLELITWMRRWNETHGQKLSFAGIDIQQATPNLVLALDYIDRFDPSGGTLRDTFAAFMANSTDQRTGYRQMSTLTPEAARALREAAEALVRRLDADRPRLEAASGRDAWFQAKGAAVAAAYYFLMEGPHADWAFRNFFSDYDIRDRAMADLALLARDRLGDGGRLFVWAHNAHVTKVRFEGNRMTMGMFLTQHDSHNYVATGFAFDEGRFQAFPEANPATPDVKPGLTEMSLGPAPHDHSEAVLRQVRAPLWLADLRKLVPGTPAHGWFGMPRQLRWTGSSFSPALMAKHEPIALSADFDALIFVRHTTRSRPLVSIRDRFGIAKAW